MSVEKSEIEVDLKAAVEDGVNDEITPDVDEIEVTWTPEEAEEAEAMGWIPPERAKKLPEGKSFTPPVEYMKRNPLYNKMKQLESSIGQLTEHHQKVTARELKKAEKEFDQRIAELEAQKIEALDNADHKLVGEIDKELRSTEKPEPEQQGEDPAFTAWKSKNEWYENDRFLQIEADRVGERLYSPDLTGIPLFDAVTDHLKQAFPEKFKNPAREKPSAVEGGSARPASKSKAASTKDLTIDEQQVFNNFRKMGIFTEEGSEQKYLNEVIELRD